MSNKKTVTEGGRSQTSSGGILDVLKRLIAGGWKFICLGKFFYEILSLDKLIQLVSRRLSDGAFQHIQGFLTQYFYFLNIGLDSLEIYPWGNLGASWGILRSTFLQSSARMLITNKAANPSRSRIIMFNARKDNRACESGQCNNGAIHSKS